MRRVLLIIAAGLAVVVASVVPGMAAGRARVKAARASTAAWRVQPSPNYGDSRTTRNELRGVAATSAKNAWAVGYYWHIADTNNDKTVIERWNGKAWKLQPSPNPSCSGRNPKSSVLYGVAATSANNAWAVGYCTVPRRPLIEH